MSSCQRNIEVARDLHSWNKAFGPALRPSVGFGFWKTGEENKPVIQTLRLLVLKSPSGLIAQSDASRGG
jgi:hypothetical protein